MRKIQDKIDVCVRSAGYCLYEKAQKVNFIKELWLFISILIKFSVNYYSLNYIPFVSDTLRLLGSRRPFVIIDDHRSVQCQISPKCIVKYKNPFTISNIGSFRKCSEISQVLNMRDS